MMIFGRKKKVKVYDYGNYLKYYEVLKKEEKFIGATYVNTRDFYSINGPLYWIVKLFEKYTEKDIEVIKKNTLTEKEILEIVDMENMYATCQDPKFRLLWKHLTDKLSYYESGVIFSGQICNGCKLNIRENNMNKHILRGPVYNEDITKYYTLYNGEIKQKMHISNIIRDKNTSFIEFIDSGKDVLLFSLKEPICEKISSSRFKCLINNKDLSGLEHIVKDRYTVFRSIDGFTGFELFESVFKEKGKDMYQEFIDISYDIECDDEHGAEYGKFIRDMIKKYDIPVKKRKCDYDYCD